MSRKIDAYLETTDEGALIACANKESVGRVLIALAAWAIDPDLESFKMQDSSPECKTIQLTGFPDGLRSVLHSLGVREKTSA